MSFNDFKKEVQTRANNFFSTKSNSLNISAYKFKDNYIDILKSHTLCILDTETTGLDINDKLWQISIRVVNNGKQIDELYVDVKSSASTLRFLLPLSLNLAKKVIY